MTKKVLALALALAFLIFTAMTAFAQDQPLSLGKTHFTLELDAKRAFALSLGFVVDVGAGLSFNRVSFSHNAWFSDDDWEVTDWVFGGQVMSDFYFKAGSFLLGLKLKYQLTADLPEVSEEISPDDGWDYSNFKIGLQIGFLIPD